MRLDKYLALSGLVRRRTKAQEACERGYVEVDGRPARPGRQVRSGQEITLRLGPKELRYRIVALPDRPVPRARQHEVATLLSSREPDLEAD